VYLVQNSYKPSKTGQSSPTLKWFRLLVKPWSKTGKMSGDCLIKQDCSSRVGLLNKGNTQVVKFALRKTTVLSLRRTCNFYHVILANEMFGKKLYIVNSVPW
jgi:hypothetical protein